MSVYAGDHAEVYDSLLAAGASVAFALTATTRTASTGAVASTTTTTVSGAAIRVRGDRLKYKDLGLVESDAVTLLFSPATRGALPALGASVTWGSVAYVVKEVEVAIAIDGTALLARVIAVR